MDLVTMIWSSNELIMDLFRALSLKDMGTSSYPEDTRQNINVYKLVSLKFYCIGNPPRSEVAGLAYTPD